MTAPKIDVLSKNPSFFKQFKIVLKSICIKLTCNPSNFETCNLYIIFIK